MRSVPFFDERYPVKTVYTENNDPPAVPGWDEADVRNAAIASFVSVPVSKVVYAREIHSGSIFAVTSKDSSGRIVHTEEAFITKTPGGYDSVITNIPGIMMCITTADCLPLFLYDTVHHAAAITHCGWRGTASGIASNTIRKMGELYGSESADIIAATGPCICGKCYEVGEELIDAFSTTFSDDEIKGFFTPKENGKYLLDNRAAVLCDISRLGITPDHISDTGICSFESPGFASYRRDGRVIPSRQTISAIVMKEL